MTTYLFYRTEWALPDAPGVGLWQRELGCRIGVTGEVAVSPQGMHGSLWGSVEQLADYAGATQQHPALVDLRFRWGLSAAVPPSVLNVTVADDLAGFEVLADLWVDATEGNAGHRLTPRQVYDQVAVRGMDVHVLGPLDPGTAELGRCEACGAETRSYRDCVAPLCQDHALLCNGCADFALCAGHRN